MFGQKQNMIKAGKQKNKIVKPVVMNYGDVDPKLQFNIPKGVEEDKKVKPKDVFEGYKDPLSKPKKQYTKKSNRKNTSSNQKK